MQPFSREPQIWSVPPGSPLECCPTFRRSKVRIQFPRFIFVGGDRPSYASCLGSQEMYEDLINFLLMARGSKKDQLIDGEP